MNKFILVLLVVIFLAPGFVYAVISSTNQNVFLDDNRIPAKLGASCTTNSTNASLISTASGTIDATSTTRAYVRIQRVTDASGMATTGPISLSFDEGAAAILSSGISLSTSTPFIEFGIDTTFPYTGTVTGLTTAGASTVLVTSCSF